MQLCSMYVDTQKCQTKCVIKIEKTTATSYHELKIGRSILYLNVKYVKCDANTSQSAQLNDFGMDRNRSSLSSCALARNRIPYLQRSQCELISFE